MKKLNVLVLISTMIALLLSTNVNAQRNVQAQVPPVTNLKIDEVNTTSVTLSWGLPYIYSIYDVAGFGIYKNAVWIMDVPSTLIWPNNYIWRQAIGGLSEGTSYVFSVKVKPSRALVNPYIEPATIIVNTPLISVAGQYCNPSNNSPHAQANTGSIGRVTFNTISNLSSGTWSTYADYSSLSTNVFKGSTYDLSVIAISPTNGKIDNLSFVAWIDYNKNFRFEDNEVVLTRNLSSANIATESVKIPSTALDGPTRMRVAVANIDRSFVGPCEPLAVIVSVSGEFEDYTINIQTPDVIAPTVPANLTASNITGTSLTLNWAASTDNVGVAAYDVYKDGVLLTTVNTNTASITGLTQNSAYQFYVRAKDASGNVSGISNTLSVKTLDAQAPTVPANLVASNVSSNSLTLSWVASTDNVGVTAYDVYKDGVLLTTVNTNAANITGLTQNSAYLFYVRAKDAAGNVSGISNTISVNTKTLIDSQAPSAPIGLVASGIGARYVSLNWKASTDNVGVIKYDIYKNGSYFISTTTNSANIASLYPNSTNTFYVRAKDAAGNVSLPSNTITVKLSAYKTTSIDSNINILSDSDINIPSKIVAYPNPFVNDFEINASEGAKILIYDQNGLLKEQYSVTKDGTPKMGAKLSKGLYFIQINQGTKTEYIKVLKK